MLKSSLMQEDTFNHLLNVPIQCSKTASDLWFAKKNLNPRITRDSTTFDHHVSSSHGEIKPKSRTSRFFTKSRISSPVKMERYDAPYAEAPFTYCRGPNYQQSLRLFRTSWARYPSLRCARTLNTTERRLFQAPECPRSCMVFDRKSGIRCLGLASLQHSAGLCSHSPCTEVA